MRILKPSFSSRLAVGTFAALFFAFLVVDAASGGIFGRRVRVTTPSTHVGVSTAQRPTLAPVQTPAMTVAQQTTQQPKVISTPPVNIPTKAPTTPVNDPNAMPQPTVDPSMLQQPTVDPGTAQTLPPQNNTGTITDPSAPSDFVPQPVPQVVIPQGVPVVPQPQYPPTIVVPPPRSGIGVHTSPYQTDVHVGPGIGVHTNPSGAVNVHVGRFLNLNIPGFAPAPQVHPVVPAQPVYPVQPTPHTRPYRWRHR